MTATFGPSNALSSYLPIEIQIEGEEQDIRKQIAARERLTAQIVNIKENANYETFEILTAQQWFSTVTAPSASTPIQKRYSFRKVFDMVALNGGNIGSGATASFAHNITGLSIPTRTFGTATTTAPRYLPLPYSSATANLNIEIYFTTTNVVIINGAGQPALTQAYITIEYIKS